MRLRFWRRAEQSVGKDAKRLSRAERIFRTTPRGADLDSTLKPARDVPYRVNGGNLNGPPPF